MTTLTYSFDQLAVALGKPASTLRQHLPDLVEKHGFPDRLPLLENVWSRAAVDDWVRNNGRPAAMPAPFEADHLALRYGVPQ